MSEKKLTHGIRRLASCLPMFRIELLDLLPHHHNHQMDMPRDLLGIGEDLEDHIQDLGDDFTEIADLDEQEIGHGSNEIYMWQTGAPVLPHKSNELYLLETENNDNDPDPENLGFGGFIWG